MAKRRPNKANAKAAPKKKKAPAKTKAKATPKKRTPAKAKAKPKDVNEIKTTRKKPVRKKTKQEFIKVSENSNSARFNKLGERIQKGEIKWAYYAVDGKVGYHYYLVL